MRSGAAPRDRHEPLSPHGLACAGPTSVPIMHLHLLQRCSLQCLHCYSESGPAAATALTVDQALGAVTLADELGYTHIALSGGEPLLFPQLDLVIERACALDLHVSIVTNGMQAHDPANLSRLANADSVCVSLDGVGATHDTMRQRQGAYVRALRGLASMREAGLHCGVSCGVTTRNIDELEAVVAAATQAGARFVNFHAIEAAGRAVTLQHGMLLDRASQTVLYVASSLIGQSVACSCSVHCDLVHKAEIAKRPQMLYLEAMPIPQSGTPASQLGVLVVEPTGHLAPVCYGFDRKWSLGTLQQAIDSDGASVAEHLPAVTAALRRAGKTLLRDLDEEDWVVFNPSAELARTAVGEQDHPLRPRGRSAILSRRDMAFHEMR